LDDVFNFHNLFVRSLPLFTPLEVCSYPMVCGEYGFCSDGVCTDYPDFTYSRPVNGRQLNLGCSPVTPLSCPSTKNHHLLPLADVSYFNINDLDAAFLRSTN